MSSFTPHFSPNQFSNNKKETFRKMFGLSTAPKAASKYHKIAHMTHVLISIHFRCTENSRENVLLCV